MIMDAVGGFFVGGMLPSVSSLKVTKQCFEFYKVQFVASSIFVRLGQSTGNNFQF